MVCHSERSGESNGAIARAASMNEAVGESLLRPARVVVILPVVWAAHVFDTTAQVSVARLCQILKPLLAHALERKSDGRHTRSAQGLAALVD